MKLRKNTRRSLSLRARSFLRLHHLAKKLGVARSALVEQWIDQVADQHDIPDIDQETAKNRIRCGSTEMTVMTEAEVEEARKEWFG